MKRAILALGLILVGCAKPGAYVVQHPGAINQADDQIYGSLIAARASLESAKSLVPMYPALRSILNTRVIPPFNALESAYLAYHAALAAGQTVDSTPLQVELSAVSVALADALKSVGATK